MDFESAEAEAVDGGKDVVGGFDPAEGLWLGVVGVDVGEDVGLEGSGRAVDAEVGVKWMCQRGRLANQSRMSLVLWLPALSMTRWMSRSAGTFRSTVSRKRRNSRARWPGKHWPMTLPTFTSSAAPGVSVPRRL